MSDRRRSRQARAAAKAGRDQRSKRSFRLVLFGLGSAVAVAILLLLGLGLASVADHDWHVAVKARGWSVNRADFRARSSVLVALATAQSAMVDRLWLAGQATDAERIELEARTAVADLVGATVGDLARERAVREAAAAEAITAPSVDPWAELAEAAVDPAALHVRYLTLGAPSPVPPAGPTPSGWPSIPAGSATDAEVLAARELAARMIAASIAGSPAEGLAATAGSAGWSVTAAADRWISTQGPVDGMPDTLVARLREPGVMPGAVIGPYLDEASGNLVVGVRLGSGPPADVDRMRRDLGDLGVDDGALRRWAEARALERALAAVRAREWTSAPSTITNVAEVVISPVNVAGAPGPYAGLAHLVVDQLPPDLMPARDPHPVRAVGSRAGVLADSLRAMPLPERLKRWDALVAAANATGPVDTLHESGEMGWYDASRLNPELAVAATGAGARAGLIIGPIETDATVELYLVRSTYPGVLDERAGGILTELATADDPEPLARRIAQGAQFLRYAPGLARSELEAIGNAPAATALTDGPLGRPTQPYAIGADIVVAIPRDRREAIPEGQVRERILVGSFTAWLSDRTAKMEVEVDDNPFGASAASPSPAPTVTIPTLEPMPTPPDIVLPGESGQ